MVLPAVPFLASTPRGCLERERNAGRTYDGEMTHGGSFRVMLGHLPPPRERRRHNAFHDKPSGASTASYPA